MQAFLVKPLLYCYMLSGLLTVSKPAPVSFHPLHVSTTDISYNAQDGKLEVICTIFTDDLETAINKEYHSQADLIKPSARPAAEALVKKYVIDHVLIKPGTLATGLNYIGYEIKDGALNVYLESDKVTPFKKIGVDISLLHNLYQDQINIVHITVNGVRKARNSIGPTGNWSRCFRA